MMAKLGVGGGSRFIEEGGRLAEEPRRQNGEVSWKEKNPSIAAGSSLLVESLACLSLSINFRLRLSSIRQRWHRRSNP